MAQMWGATDYPLIFTEHPISHLTREQLRQRAEEMMDQIARGSKENAKALLDEIVAILGDRFGVADVRYHRKPSASKPAEPEVIQNLAASCDYAIVAIGS